VNPLAENFPSAAAVKFSGSPLGEDCVRPLGKGYRNIISFLEPYLSAFSDGVTTTPTLATSLHALLEQPVVGEHMRRLPKNATCLIQGYSTPGNADALRAFLCDHGIDSPSLWAVDLFDIGAVYQTLKIPLPKVEFRIADAADLPPSFQGGSFHLILQDFLLNCLPLAHHRKLLRETARILSPAGYALIHFTDATGAQHLRQSSAHDLRSRHGIRWDETAYQLSDMTSSLEQEAAIRLHLGGTIVTTPECNQLTYVVPVDGRFEFFPDAARIFSLMDEAGLETITIHCSQGVDNNGLQCRRYRCLSRKNPGMA